MAFGAVAGQPNGWPTGSQVCTSYADGLSVYIFTGANVTPDAVAIFAHHLRLLGANPAGWAMQPVR